ncbi:MAG: hypothetical protein ACOCQP_02415 [Lentisphaeria bacterium]
MTNKSLAIIPLDSQQVRKKYITKCKRAQTTYRKAREELDYFEKTEKPAFERWLYQQVGAYLTEHRELLSQIEAKQHLIQRIQMEAILTGSAPEEAYQRILDGESELDQPDEEWGKEDDFSDGEEEDWDDEDFSFEDDLNEFFDFLNDTMNEFMDMDEEDEDEDEQEDFSEEEEQRDNRLKEIYRDICRRLHPDADGADTAEELEIWYEVQEAYNENDVERLETLRAKTDIAQGGLKQVTSVSAIQRITEEFRQARASIRSLIRRARKEEAWGFFKLTPEQLNRKSEITRRQLQEEKEYLRENLQEIESVLEDLDELRKARQQKQHQRRASSRNKKNTSQSKKKQNSRGKGFNYGQPEFDFS